ncbi:MAG: D-glycerate dehydrogenase [Alphaproteobacteria bacterium]|nr:D-glycerate dehydrogenase [Alphaproteobacteria bacterium]
MKRVLFLHAIPANAIQKIKKQGFNVTVLKKETLSEKEIVLALQKYKPMAIVSLLVDEINASVLDVAKKVGTKVCANYAVGFNNIDIARARNNGIVVTNTPDVLTNTVAEHTVALILACATRLIESDQYVRKNKFRGWKPELLLGHDLKNKIVGIAGAGRIGARVAEILHKGFDMNVYYYDITRNHSLEKKCNAKFIKNVRSLAALSDIFSIHLPLLSTTFHSINTSIFKKMKKNAIIVNAARGPIINEKNLISALHKGNIFSAGLDVFEHEPHVPAQLKKSTRTVLTPHTASASVETRQAMAELVADNVIAVCKGKKPITPIL